MQEDLSALVRTQAMQLFRQQGLHFTMQQVAEPLHISKKTIYTVYPSKEALLLDMVDHAFAEIHRCKQEILAGSGTLQEKLRAVIIAMPAEYAALDLQQMKELFTNLATNAIKYNRPGGQVWITVGEQGDDMLVRVKDNGVGIPKESLDRIFERFYRVDKGRSRKQGGTGLGLSIVKHIVNFYHGTIHVTSELDKGTEFTVTIPLDMHK